MTAATHNVPTPAPTETYEEKRAKRVTKRQQREAKRRYEQLKGLLRSQLRRQLDEILKPNEREFVFLLLNGGALNVSVQAKAPPADGAADDSGAMQQAADALPTGGAIVDIKSALRAIGEAPAKPSLIVLP